MMNIDWFQCHKRRSDNSTGVIYMVLLNLPREIRYKEENSMVVGIIPNLSKEPEHLNEFLKPIVKELQALWKKDGVQIRTANHPKGVFVKGALLCVSCDVPACRKTCGFMGHAARQGCSKCMKEFSGTVGKMDYSGFDMKMWQPRLNTTHRFYVTQLRSEETL